MQHPEGPTWCKDCGRFDFACGSDDCPAAGAGSYDQQTEAGARRIAGYLVETFCGGTCPAHLEPEPCPTCAAYVAAGL